MYLTVRIYHPLIKDGRLLRNDLKVAILFFAPKRFSFHKIHLCNRNIAVIYLSSETQQFSKVFLKGLASKETRQLIRNQLILVYLSMYGSNSQHHVCMTDDKKNKKQGREASYVTSTKERGACGHPTSCVLAHFDAIDEASGTSKVEYYASRSDTFLLLEGYYAGYVMDNKTKRDRL